MLVKKPNDIVFRAGKNVALRPPFEADLDLIVKWINDPEVTHNLATTMPCGEHEELEWIRNASQRKPTDIIFIMMHESKPVGVIGAHRITLSDRTASMGVYIGEKELWGKGIGGDAQMLLLDYLFNSLNLRKVWCTVLQFNDLSLGHVKKCGYEVEGVQKEHIFKNGKYWDLVMLGVFRDKWFPIWERFSKNNLTFKK